jgi:hypothetical protein
MFLPLGSALCRKRRNFFRVRQLSMVIQQEVKMPAKSRAQQKAAGAALSAKRGDTKVSDLKGASRSMVKSMSEKQLDEMASTKRKGKPEHDSRD